MAFERFFKALWKSELQKLNDHLPREYKTLSQLLKENDPAVPTVGGDLIFLDKADLETMASLVPEKYHGRLRLPLVFIRRIDMGEGVYTVSGGLVEQLTVSSLLNDKEGFIEDYEKAVKYVYRPQLWYLKKRVRSLIVVGFFMPKIEAP